jgi:hypothetical protein
MRPVPGDFPKGGVGSLEGNVLGGDDVLVGFGNDEPIVPQLVRRCGLQVWVTPTTGLLSQLARLGRGCS